MKVGGHFLFVICHLMQLSCAVYHVILSACRINAIERFCRNNLHMSRHFTHSSVFASLCDLFWNVILFKNERKPAAAAAFVISSPTLSNSIDRETVSRLKWEWHPQIRDKMFSPTNRAHTESAVWWCNIWWLNFPPLTPKWFHLLFQLFFNHFQSFHFSLLHLQRVTQTVCLKCAWEPNEGFSRVNSQAFCTLQ